MHNPFLNCNFSTNGILNDQNINFVDYSYAKFRRSSKRRKNNKCTTVVKTEKRFGYSIFLINIRKHYTYGEYRNTYKYNYGNYDVKNNA